MVSTITNATAATNTSAPSLSKLSGNFDDFLKLLMTQLRNQDPTSPMDTNQFTTQLVQFSSVEQQINTNGSLSKLISLQQGNEVLQSSALIGKTVQIKSDHVGLQSSGADVQFTSPSAGPVTISIATDAGIGVRQVTLASGAGANTWHWDGLDDNGRAVAPASYAIGVKSGESASAGSAMAFTTSGVATSVQRAGDGFAVSVAGQAVPLSAVQSIQ